MFIVVGRHANVVLRTSMCTDIRGASCTAACLASGYECP